jgi:TetR/AcrR family transcriptional repressor of nem operon
MERQLQMRMSKEAMARHHDEIVAAASRMLRERGIEGTSVADLMQAAGLTHGGFYRHFESKDALVAEATEEAFGGMLDAIDASFEKLGPAEGLKRFVSRYLSDGHVKGPGSGCVVAALGSESARAGPAVCKTFAERIRKQIEKLSSGFEGTPTERRAKAARLFATLVGAVVIARAAGGLANHVLSACREDFENGAT